MFVLNILLKYISFTYLWYLSNSRNWVWRIYYESSSL